MIDDSHLVSIIIPSYNHGKYIVGCLDSIVANDYKNVEIVIIDDGSKDDSIKIVEKWGAEHEQVKLVLRARENRGLMKTLNELVALASGEYLVFIASDDKLTNTSISHRLALLLANPKKKAVIGDAIVIDQDDNIVYNSAIEELYKGNKANYMSDKMLRHSVVYEWSVPGPVLMMKKDIFDEIGPYPEDLFAEDIYFYLRVIGKDLLIFLDESVAYYRYHEANTWRNPAHRRNISKTFIKSYARNLKYFEFKLQLRLIKKILGRIYLLVKD